MYLKLFFWLCVYLSLFCGTAAALTLDPDTHKYDYQCELSYRGDHKTVLDCHNFSRNCVKVFTLRQWDGVVYDDTALRCKASPLSNCTGLINTDDIDIPVSVRVYDYCEEKD